MRRILYCTTAGHQTGLVVAIGLAAGVARNLGGSLIRQNSGNWQSPELWRVRQSHTQCIRLLLDGETVAFLRRKEDDRRLPGFLAAADQIGRLQRFHALHLDVE